MHKRLRRPNCLPYTPSLINDVDAQHLTYLPLLLASESIYHLHTGLAEEKRWLSHGTYRYTPPYGDLEESSMDGRVVVVLSTSWSLHSEFIGRIC